MLPEVRMARIIDAIGLHRKKRLSCVEAGALLGMSERHFRRLRDAYEERGAEGIVDRRCWGGGGGGGLGAGGGGGAGAGGAGGRGVGGGAGVSPPPSLFSGPTPSQ